MRVVVAASIGWLALPVFGVQAAPRSAFEPNTGRWPMAVNFHAAASGLDLWITRDALVWSARAAEQSVALRWVFDDASARDAAQLLDAARPLDARGEDAVCERRSHVRGAHACSTDTLWRRVRCVDVARGIDLVVRESAGALEYDLELAPGARLEDVAVRCEGHEDLWIDAQGGLVIETALGAVRQSAPIAWQGDAPLAVRFRRIDALHFGFEAPERERFLAATIDPAVRWASYLGGGSDQTGEAAALAPGGKLVVAGMTQSVDFPWTIGAYDNGYSGGLDSYVACFSPDGAQLEWSTFFGGANDDVIRGLAVTANGAIVVAGETKSSDCPTTVGAFDTQLGGTQDVFVARLAADGSALEWGSYFGGAGLEHFGALALAANDDVVVVGATRGAGVPLTVGAYDTSYNGGPFYGDAFVAKLASDGASVRWSTLLGSPGDDFAEHVALASNGDVAVSGTTYNALFPLTAGAFDATFQGPDEPFVARLDASGANLLSSTFFGAASTRSILALAVAASGASYCVGHAAGDDVPLDAAAFDRRFTGGGEGFVTALTGDGRRLVHSTYYGGNGDDLVTALAFDAQGALVIAGETWSTDFPTTPGAYDRDANALSGNPTSDAFVARLASDLHSASYSTYFGGRNPEHVAALALDSVGAVFFAGTTAGADLPTTPGAFQSQWNVTAAHEAFAARFEMLLHPIPFGTPKLNSQGSAATMRWSGFPSVAEQSLKVGLENALANAWSSIFQGFATINMPFQGGRLRVRPPFVRTPRFKTDSFGYAERPIALDAAWIGQTLYFQVWYEDQGDPYGSALSNALRVFVYP